MIREYFLTNYLFSFIQLKIHKKYLILHVKSVATTSKYYYIYLLKSLYNIYPHSINVQIYQNNYKIITIKYLL